MFGVGLAEVSEAWNRPGELDIRKLVKLRLPQNYVSRWRWLQERQGQAIDSKLWEMTCRAL